MDLSNYTIHKKPRFIVELDFQDGTGWIDLSDYTRLKEFKRTRHVYNSLSPTTDSCSFKIKYNSQVINRLLSTENDIKVRIYKEMFSNKTSEDDDDPNGTYSEEVMQPYFTGYLEKDYKMQSATRVDWVELSLVDMSYQLDNVITQTIQKTSVNLMDGLNTDNSLVHHILHLAGFTDEQIDDDVLFFNDEIIVVEFFKHLLKAPESDNPALKELPYGGTYKDVLTNLLFQYGFTYYFDASGIFKIFDFKVKDVLTFDMSNIREDDRQPAQYYPEINNTNMEGKLIFEKKPPRYEASEITWNEIQIIEDKIIFDDSTGADGAQYPLANITIPAGGYYPADTITEAFYDFTIDGKPSAEYLLAVENATLLSSYESTYMEPSGNEPCVEYKDGISTPQEKQVPIMDWKGVDTRYKCEGLIKSLGSVIVNWITENKYVKKTADSICCANKVCAPKWLGGGCLCYLPGVNWKIETFAYMPVGYTKETVQPVCLKREVEMIAKTSDGSNAITEEFSVNPLSFNIRIHNTDTKDVRITKMQVRADKIFVRGDVNTAIDESHGVSDKVFRYSAPYIHNETMANRLASSVLDYFYYSTFKYKLRSRDEFEPGEWVILSDKNFQSIDGQPLSNKFCLVKSRIDLEFEEIHDYELEEFKFDNIKKEVVYLYAGGTVTAYNKATYYATVNHNYNPTDGITTSGSADYNLVYNKNVEGSGSINISGAAETEVIQKHFGYIGTGGIQSKGSAPMMEGVNHFVYSMSGKIKTGGAAYYYEYNKYITAEGGIELYGTAGVPVISRNYEYTGTEGINTSGTVDIELIFNYLYDGSGSMSTSGEADTSLHIPIFITTWRTTSTNKTVLFPLDPLIDGQYDFTIDWGDGTVEQIVYSTDAIHEYATAGDFEVRAIGSVKDWGFTYDTYTYAPRLIDVNKWGSGVRLHDGGNQLFFTSLTTLSATDAPNLSTNTLLRGCFAYSTIQSGVSNWDVSNIVWFANMFSGASSFNEDLPWDTSSAKYMGHMFENASSFNGDISNWNTSNVILMNYMFRNTVFNQPLNWNTSNVARMEYMFSGSSFNQPLSFDTSKVMNFSNMFYDSDFNQDLTFIDISSIDTTNIRGQMLDFATYSNIDSTNYSDLLIHLASQGKNKVLFSAYNIYYNASAAGARSKLISIMGWNIKDGGQV